MKNITTAVLFTVLMLVTRFAFSQVPQLGQAPVDSVIKAMTIEEKACMLLGTGMASATGNEAVIGETSLLVPGAAGTSWPISRLGIPAIALADGPAGVRISPTRKDNNKTYYCTGFPVGSSLAQSWNIRLVEEIGRAMGNEVLEYGVDVLLAPALNIHRNPLNGRNFEYYSEDPLVSGKMAAAMTRGIQSNGVGISLKHFVANNQESNRNNNDTRVSERALREIYLKGFEIAVKESSPWTIMTALNRVNGVYASESKPLLTGVLREEWNFDGFVMTDWVGGSSSVAMIEAGNDMMQPGLKGQFEELVAGMKSGRLPMETIDTSVRRILEIVLRSPRFKGYKYSDNPDLKAHAEITRKSATECMVLLENNNHALPLASTVKKIAAFGISSYDLIAGGSGSGNVNKAYTVSLIEGLSNVGFNIDSDLEKVYNEYLEEEAKKPSKLPRFMPKSRPDEYIPYSELIESMAKSNDLAIITIGRSSGEFLDRNLEGDFTLTENETELIKNVSDVFHKKNKKIVVILNTGGVIETAKWISIPDAVLLAGQVGQEGGNSIADVLKGTVNPSGKLTDTYPVNYEDHWSSGNFPFAGDEQQYIKNSPKTLSNKKKNVDYTVYEEGIYVGYRYFDKYKVPVSYPFGYGLSYTTFEYSNAKLVESDSVYTVNVTIKNIGKCSGKEVVQLYVSAPESKYADKPLKELKAFGKTSELQPGKSQTLSLVFTKSDIASFNTLEKAWITDAGIYKAIVGASLVDVKIEIPFTVSKTEWVEKVSTVL
jgi:beta-glucosidase